MTSSKHDLSDSSEADDPRKNSDRHLPPLPASGLPHPGITLPNVPSGAPSQLENGNLVAPPVYPHPDPYCRSIFACYDGQPMVHKQFMELQQAGGRGRYFV